MSTAIQQEMTLKKSRGITLTIMATLAAACADGRTNQASDGTVTFTAADTVRRCVDAEQCVVSDSLCMVPQDQQQRSGTGFYPYFFYFGGRTFTQGGSAYVSGGSRTMPAIRGPVTRGGIGATSRARAR